MKITITEIKEIIAHLDYAIDAYNIQSLEVDDKEYSQKLDKSNPCPVCKREFGD